VLLPFLLGPHAQVLMDVLAKLQIFPIIRLALVQHAPPPTLTLRLILTKSLHALMEASSDSLS